jgi:protein involved in polysaccharide export with SLBB domain
VFLPRRGIAWGPGDKLKVTIFGKDDASGEYEIDATGSISVRLLGRVEVKGMTVSEVEQMLTDQYRSRDFFRNPRLSVELTYLRPFFILGQVVKGGSYPISGLTVAQAVAIAGGYTYRASKRSITIQRIGKPKESPSPKMRRSIRATSFVSRSDFFETSREVGGLPPTRGRSACRRAATLWPCSQ